MGRVDGVYEVGVVKFGRVGKFDSQRSRGRFSVTTACEKAPYTPETVRNRDTRGYYRHYVDKRVFVVFADIVLGRIVDYKEGSYAAYKTAEESHSSELETFRRVFDIVIYRLKERGSQKAERDRNNRVVKDEIAEFRVDFHFFVVER